MVIHLHEIKYHMIQHTIDVQNGKNTIAERNLLLILEMMKLYTDPLNIIIYLINL